MEVFCGVSFIDLEDSIGNWSMDYFWNGSGFFRLCFLVTRQNFVRSVIGQLEELTWGILETTTKKVLVIDEVYSFYHGACSKHEGSGFSGPYKTVVIDTIVGEVQNILEMISVCYLLGMKCRSWKWSTIPTQV